jgi:hypothetical protein
MTNFQFLLPDFKPLVEPAKGADRPVISATDIGTHHCPHPGSA